MVGHEAGPADTQRDIHGREMKIIPMNFSSPSSIRSSFSRTTGHLRDMPRFILQRVLRFVDPGKYLCIFFLRPDFMLARS
ncbi:hypothetical protein BJY01DRAFT_208436 [Aspergillus pseudoustus]|uniref:F-box domain-containing protein n=1 Tax=Aspergillus pseudoustus TaxID=1810923 RepID=A0ABR4KIF6_9EURO